MLFALFEGGRDGKLRGLISLLADLVGVRVVAYDVLWHIFEIMKLMKVTVFMILDLCE